MSSENNSTDLGEFIAGKKKPKKFATTVYLTQDELDKLDEMAENFSTSRTGITEAMINVYYRGVNQ